MKVLVIGGGGREHAIVHTLKKSPKVDYIWCAPGNGGIAAEAECVAIKATDIDGMVAFNLYATYGFPIEMTRELAKEHGLTVDEARDTVAAFLSENQARNHRCVRIVHGKGYGSVGGQSILKELVRRWLKQRREVMCFVEAPPNDGGGGAVLVLLSQAPRR